MIEDESLNRLKTAWRSQGAPIADNLAPGLSAAEIDAYEAEHGLVLPAELRQWWGWHDGAVTGKASGGPSAVGAGPWTLMSLAEALDERSFQLDMNDRPFDPDDWDGEWSPSFLPVVTVGNAWLFADLSASDGDRAPIHLWGHAPDNIFTVAAPNWADVVTTWTRSIEAGVFTWSRAEGRWVRAGTVPPELRPLL
jgi:cell wall assembly regulator SMI1